MGHMGDYGWWGGMGMLLFWGLLIVGIVMLARGSSGSGALREARAEKSALDILKERHARGEIEREEFEQKKRDLGEWVRVARILNNSARIARRDMSAAMC